MSRRRPFKQNKTVFFHNVLMFLTQSDALVSLTMYDRSNIDINARPCRQINSLSETVVTRQYLFVLSCKSKRFDSSQAKRKIRINKAAKCHAAKLPTPSDESLWNSQKTFWTKNKQEFMPVLPAGQSMCSGTRLTIIFRGMCHCLRGVLWTSKSVSLKTC